MAIRKLTNESEQAQQWKPSLPFPKDNYAIRCIDEKIDKSKKGNPMVTLEWEIVNAAPQMVQDKLVEFDGVTFKTYHTTRVINKDDATVEEIAKSSQKAFDEYGKLLAKAGYDVSEGYDDENPPRMLGKIMYVCLRAEERIEYKEPNAEQKAAGKPGDIIKDGNGKDRKTYSPRVSFPDDWYGQYTGDVKPRVF